MLINFVQGGLAACLACLFTNPIEVIKIKFQLQGELTNRNKGQQYPIYKSIKDCLKNIIYREGLSGLQKGLGAALLYQLVMNSCRLGTYDWLKGTEEQKHLQLVVNGSVAGVVGGLISNPLSIVKVRVQAGEHYATAIQQVYSKGLWLGWQAVVGRVGIGSGVQLSTYDLCKYYLVQIGLPTGVIVQVLASGWSGVLVVIAMNPWDVATTRLQNQTTIVYSGPIHCLATTVANEGFMAIYKGFFPNLYRIAPHTILTLVFQDQIKLFTTKYYQLTH